MATITHTDIWKFSIPMHPFTIATGTMHYAQNTFIRIHTSDGIYGVGECSAFPMITGETQATCFEMAKEFAALWKGNDAADIETRLKQLDDFTAFNSTIKSAFDMALYDLAAKNKGQPLYAFLGGHRREMETDLTIGIDSPANMALTAIDFVKKGTGIIKIKLGKDPSTDIERVRLIREVTGTAIKLRVDANQGWSFDDAITALNGIARYDVQFCEQPMRHWNDHLLPLLKKRSAVPIMADESVYNHHDAARLINANATDYVNVKFSKSGGIREAIRIHETCKTNNIYCMMGGMLESRVALTAFAHFATSHEQIKFFDMDTVMLGHKVDPVIRGIQFNGFFITLPPGPGIDADADDAFLQGCERITV